MSLLGSIYSMCIGRWYQKKGCSIYYVNFLRKELKAAYKNTGLPKKDVKWAKDRGFFPWRIAQCGLTEENWRSVFSDRDYYYLHPINNKYRIWIDDKLTMKYLLAPFDRFLPQYYFQIMKDRDVMRLMNCPENLPASADGVISLLEERGLLAAKKSSGVYGVGFYKLAYEDGKYIVNGKPYDRAGFSAFLTSLDDYLITEFVEMHPYLKKIYPGSVNTVRVIMINEHGNDPIVPFAFLRIGTKKSGSVDNVAQGGMVMKVDVDTGRLYDAQSLHDHVYRSETVHPDTGVPLEGELPNWEIVKQGIVDIARYCPQFKWLGYDIAITQDGFQIVEINSHPGLHKPHELPAEITDFLFRELDAKKKKYGIKQS